MDTRPATERRRIDSFAAVLWDMDGTLVDTEPYWTDAELALAERYGGTWSGEHSLEVVGFDLMDAGRHMRSSMGIDVAPERIVDEMLDDVSPRSSARCRGGPGRASCWRDWATPGCRARW